MDSMSAVGVGFVLLLAWIVLQWRRQVQLDKQVDELLIISDSLSRTEGRRAHRILMRDATIGDIIKDLPPVAGGADTDPYERPPAA